MSFILEAVRDRPEGLWLLDDATPLQDYSGFGRNGTLTGTAESHAPLVHGATYAPVLSNSVTASFPVNVFQQGLESQPFSLEAWIRPMLSATGPVKLLSHTGQYDGLLIDGTKVIFTTKYLTTGEARVEYDIMSNQKVHAVGVHTKSKNSLYINGELVAEQDISAEQQVDSYLSTTTTLYSGTSASSQKVAASGFGVYASALNAITVARHYLAGTDIPSLLDVVSAFDGSEFPVNKTTADSFLSQWWQSEPEWLSGTLNNVSVYNDMLIPEVSSDVTVAGSWLDIFNIASSDDTALFGVVTSWEGKGVTIEASVDGTTWVTAINGQRLSIIPEGYDPTGKILQLRATFSSGQVPGDVYLARLNVTGFGSGTIRSVAGRTPVIVGASPLEPFDPSTMADATGTFIASGGSLTIPVDANPTPLNPRTIEVWIKRTGTNPTVSVSGTTYQNGVAASTTLIDGAWTLLHIVTAADVTGNIVINGPAYVGHVALYPTAFTAAQILSISNAYTRSNVIRVDDSTLVSITQLPEASEIYAHDWSIVGAG